MYKKSFKFRVRDIYFGCCDVIITINDKLIYYDADYIGLEPLASMIEVSAEMKLNKNINGVYKRKWLREPGEINFVFTHNDDKSLHIDIADEITKEEWHEDVLFNDCVSSIVSEGYRVLNAFGIYGYREAWADGSDFPLSMLMLISGFYDLNDNQDFNYTLDISKELRFLIDNVKRNEITSETKLEECTVYYDSWQMQCCGKPFSVGEKIKWTCTIPKRYGNAHGTIIDFYEEHHCKETHEISGTVTKIIAESSDTPLEEKRICYDKVTVNKNELQEADGWDEYNDEDNSLRHSFWGYIVELENVTIKPIEKQVK